jgi:hypothetical protein
MIRTTVWFDKELKKLAKKHKSLAADFRQLLASLEEDPTQGTPLGRGAFKIRMAITSKSAGKRGGSRVITYFRNEFDVLYLVDIYDKSEKDNISNADLNHFIDEINKTLEEE